MPDFVSRWLYKELWTDRLSVHFAASVRKFDQTPNLDILSGRSLKQPTDSPFNRSQNPIV